MALTTLDNVNQYLGLTSGNDDDLLTRLIDAASAFIENWLGRTIALGNYVETYNGYGSTLMQLRNTPVMALTSLMIGTQSIPPAASAMSAGYIWDSEMIYLRGYRFTKGYQNIVVSYSAGYAATPADIEQACIGLVAKRYKEKDRVGVQSKTIGREVIAYTKDDMRGEILGTLNNYRKVTPI